MDNVLYHVSIEDDDVGEVEGFYHNGVLITTWCRNDAIWRGEYMNSLVEGLGFTVECPDYNSPLYDELKKEWLD